MPPVDISTRRPVPAPMAVPSSEALAMSAASHDVAAPGVSEDATSSSEDVESAPWAYPGFRALVQSDVEVWAEHFAYRKPGERVRIRTAIRLGLVYAGLRAAIVHRLAYASHRAGIRIVPMILTNLNVSWHGLDIPPNIEIGRRFFVPHPVGTVVTAQHIGDGVTLVSNVTIGMRKGSGFPVLGNDVYVGAGARILGDITIGDRAQIGANAVVLKSMPPDHVAVGVPATIRPARKPD
ncbi:MAG: hypothetical protein U0V56_13815 [Actinomycetota bacterium]